MILDAVMLPSCYTFTCLDILHTLVRYDYYHNIVTIMITNEKQRKWINNYQLQSSEVTVNLI